MTNIADLMDLDELQAAIDAGHVKRQVHPSLTLYIYNYTNRCQFDKAWTHVTKQCRGLITNFEGEIIARPFAKFFNYGEHDAAKLDMTASVEVSDKIDGSLGIMYPSSLHRSGYAIATRGSFTSEQALHATQLLNDRYPDFEPPQGFTLLFEIIYPENRIVVDYGQTDDLVLLGAIDIPTGETVGPDWCTYWTGPRAQVFPFYTLEDALKAQPRDGQEGLVVRFLYSGARLKIKQEDYVALHRILTSTTERTVWEFMAVQACKHLIEKPKHWGSKLGIDPARAQQIIEIGDGWLDKLLEGVPDEFHFWLQSTIISIQTAVALQREIVEDKMWGLLTMDRKDFASKIQDDVHKGLLFYLYDGRDITTNLWKNVYPEAAKPFTTQTEDVS